MQPNHFERYAEEVARNIPAANRDEFVKELLADLYAELDPLMKRKGCEHSEDVLMRTILESRQDARSLASSFPVPQRALIGPDTFPAYRLSMLVTLAMIVSIVAACGIAFGDLAEGRGWSTAAGMGLSLVVSFTIVTITFGIVDRLGLIGPELGEAIRAIRLPRHDPSFRPWRQVLFACTLAAALNLFPGWIAFPVMLSEQSVRFVPIPILATDVLNMHRTLVNLWCLCALGACALHAFGTSGVLLIRVHLAVRALGIAVAIRVLTDGPVFKVQDPAFLSTDPASARVLEAIMPGVLSGLTAALWLAVALKIASLAWQAWWHARRPRGEWLS